MQIDHITFSKTGGAGIVAQTIASAQRVLGHNVNLLTVVDSDLRSQPLRIPLLTVAAGLDRWLLSSQHESTLFSTLRGNMESLRMWKIRRESLIHLHWMTGVMNHESVRLLLDAGHKVVWTLHDMNPFTGGCHHSHECQQFAQSCSACPQARRSFAKIVAGNLQKRNLGSRYPNLRIVSPNSWMSEQASRSVVFREQIHVVIPNPIDENFFEEKLSFLARKKLGLAEHAFVAAVVAKDLSDPNKNLALLVKALEQVALRTHRPIELLLIGRNGFSFSSQLIAIKCVGEMNSQQVSETVCAADLILSGSKAESAGMTIIEGAAMGVPSVALANGGTASLIEDNKTGILAQDFESLVSSVAYLINNPRMISVFGASARESAKNHRASEIANRYLELYASM